MRSALQAEREHTPSAPPKRDLWRWAACVLGLTTVVLALALGWILHSSSESAVPLYNSWIRETSLVDQQEVSQSGMQGRNQVAAGMAQSGTAIFGSSSSTSAKVAADLDRISSSLASIISVTLARRTEYPAYASRNQHALNRLLDRTVQELPASVRSDDELAHQLTTLDRDATRVEQAASACSLDYTAQP